MKDKDIKFFKILAIIVSLVIAIGIGGYLYGNYESPQQKLSRENKEALERIEENQKDIDELEKQLR